MNTLIPEKTTENPAETEILSETIATLQLAIRALCDPEAHIWSTLLQLLNFSRRIETMQDYEQLTPDQQMVKLLRLSNENAVLKEEMQQLVAKLGARWVCRAVQCGQATAHSDEKEASPCGIGPFDPEAEPWLAAMLSRCMSEQP